MKKLVSTLNLDKESWLRYRKHGIGGSDAGAVCGLNPYSHGVKKIENDLKTDEALNNTVNIIKKKINPV